MSQQRQTLNSLQAIDRIVVEVFGSFANPSDKLFVSPARMIVWQRAAKKTEEERKLALKRIQAILNATV